LRQNRVANRPNPEINIGAVDMSCAFVVTDVRKFDDPIVYCSATFERLTGYTKHEVLGRNCRFLQAPDGNIKSGDRRKYVDENAVYYLKNQISARAEAQTSLINYRKGGQSFTNLLTMIPIPYDDNDDIVYFVGFQVDLVDQPSAMMNRNRGIKSISTQRDL
jgi:PAS domain S-box-containing protein